MRQLFGAVILTKNADIDKHKYSGYGIGFDRHFSHPSGRTGRNIIIYGVGMSSFTKIDNRTKDSIIMEQTVIYLLMVEKFINLKQKILEL